MFEVSADDYGIGCGFENSHELRVIKFKESINGDDREGWMEE